MLQENVFGQTKEHLDALQKLLTQSEMHRRGMKAPTRALEVEVNGMLTPIRLLLEAGTTEFHKKYAKYIDNERLETPEETIERVVKETQAKGLL
jgi:hypothetical protein